MATLKQYYETDFNRLLKANKPFKAMLKSKPDKVIWEVEYIASLHFDFDARAKFISYFIPEFLNTYDLCLNLIGNYNQALLLGNAERIKFGFGPEKGIESTDLKFTGRIFVYHETYLSEEEINKLEVYAKKYDLSPVFRGGDYLENRIAVEKPLAFISYDSRDRDEVIKLATQLISMMCPVNFFLKWETIYAKALKKELKNVKNAFLFLSPQFLSNSGWAQNEFDSIFTKELTEKKKVILPVWDGVTEKQVYEYSPSLKNVVAVKWDLGVEEVARKLYHAIIGGSSTDS